MVCQIESICSEISRSSKSVLGIGIGGSIGEKTSDDLSDWDIFIFCEKSNLEEVMKCADSILAEKLNPRISRKGDYFPDFGYRNAYISLDLIILECFFLPIELVQPNPMLSKTRLIFDRNGTIEKMITNKLYNQKQVLALLRENIAFDFINCSHKLKRSIIRNDVFQATQKIGMIRGLFFSAVRFIDSGELVHPFDADKALEKKISKNYLNLIERSFPIPKMSHVIDAYNIMRISIFQFLVISSEQTNDRLADLVKSYAANIEKSDYD